MTSGLKTDRVETSPSSSFRWNSKGFAFVPTTDIREHSSWIVYEVTEQPGQYKTQKVDPNFGKLTTRSYFEYTCIG